MSHGEQRFDPLQVADEAHSDIIRMINGKTAQLWAGRILMAEDWLKTLPKDVQKRAQSIFTEWKNIRFQKKEGSQTL